MHLRTGTGVELRRRGRPADGPLPDRRRGFAAKTGAALVASRDPRGTCRSSRTVSELDYFFVQEDLAKGISNVRAVNNDPVTRPHVPVRLTFHPKLVTARALTLRNPPKLPTERIHGPVLCPPNWENVAANARELLDRARRDDFSVGEDFRRAYAEAYKSWADLAEEEIINSVQLDEPVKKLGLRGREPELVWRSILLERPPPPPAQAIAVSRWRTAAMLAQEIRAALRWLTPADDDEPEDTPQHVDTSTPMTDSELERDRCSMPNLGARMADVRDQIDGILDELTDHDDYNVKDGDEGQAYDYRDIITRLRAQTCAVEIAAAAARGDAPRLDSSYNLAATVQRLTTAAEAVHDEVQRAAQAAMAKEDALHKHEWKTWVADGIAAGARNAHRFLRLPTEWRPTTTVLNDGVVTADPLHLLEGYAQKYDKLWNPDARKSDADDAAPWKHVKVEPLPRPQPDELRAVARTFPHRTAVTFDGIAMRHYDLLSDPALGIVADFIELMERTGELPPQLALIPMPMLEKPRGGHRAIANFASLYRLWTRLRREEVRRWEQKNDRCYVAAGKGRSPQDSVWRQAARAEAAVGRGEQSASLLWDLSSFFETIRRRPLWYKVRRLGFPMAVAKLAFNTYESTRLLSIAGVLARPLPSQDGIPAGCGIAMAFTRAYTLESFDRVLAQLNESEDDPVRLDVYVDDLALAADGPTPQVVRKLTRAMQLLRDEIEGPLKCVIETDKAAVVASSRPLLGILRDKFGVYAGHDTANAGDHGAIRKSHRQRKGGNTAARTMGRTCVATNLGIDFAPGCARRSHGPRSKRATRLFRLGLKVKRLARIRAIAGKRTSGIFIAGPLPEAVYGAAVNGVSDKEALRLRRAAAVAFSPRAKGRSLGKLLLIYGVPTWRAEVEVILQYARETWAASLLGHTKPATGQLTLAELSRLWWAVDPRSRLGDVAGGKAWNSVKGPITALWLSLRRIGWSMPSPFVLTNADGDEIALTKVAPGMLATMLQAAVNRQHQSNVGAAMAQEDPQYIGRRVAAEHIEARMRNDKSLTALDKAAYRAVACNAVMTYHRAHQMGYAVDDLCPKCGQRGDTHFHRIWKCCHPEVVAAREAIAPRWLIEEANRQHASDDHIFWTTAFFPHPADVWPRPTAEANACFEWHGEGGPGPDARDHTGRPHVHGQIYIDGSCTTGIFAELRRASSSLVQWTATCPQGWRIALPVARPLPQTPQAAEYVALAVVKQFRKNEARVDVASDCANVVIDANREPARALAPSRKYAGVMKEVISDPAWTRSSIVRKVPAHVEPTSMPEGPAKDDAVGNNLADVLAKQALQLHDQPAPALVTDLEAKLRRAKAIIRVVAKVTQVFPAIPKGKIPRRPRARANVTRDDPARHDWRFTEGLWR